MRNNLCAMTVLALFVAATMARAAETAPAGPTPEKTAPAPEKSAPAADRNARPEAGKTATPVPPPSAPADAKTSEADDSKRPDPFAPSALMQERAQSTGTSTGGGTAVTSSGPTLEGLVVRGETVLASFRIGASSLFLRPGEKFKAGTKEYTFEGCKNEVVTLRDADGNVREIRLGVRE